MAVIITKTVQVSLELREVNINRWPHALRQQAERIASIPRIHRQLWETLPGMRQDLLCALIESGEFEPLDISNGL